MRGPATPRTAPAWASLVLAAACGSTTAPSQPGGRALATMFLGADISALQRIEQAGAVFRDSGKSRDAIAILHAHGANTFRLRLFVNPDHSEVQVNDLDYTIALAVRVKAAGAKLLLDLHYSDTWADPGHQTTPAAWAALDFNTLEQRVESYTAAVMAALKHAGALPDLVQVGNEIDAGFLWPLGRVGGAFDTATQWDQFTRLLKAGIRGVRDSLAAGEAVRVMLHYSQGGSSGGTQWFFDHMNTYGVPYDLIGLSYYPWWHGPLSQLKLNLDATALRYQKEIVVVETSYPWRAGGWESMAGDGSSMSWPVSPEGQLSFLSELLDTVRRTAGDRGAGLFWWYPEAVAVPGLFVWGGGSLALFDAAGNALPAASAFTRQP